MEFPTKELDDGRELTVFPLTFGRARLTIGPAGSAFLDNAW
jgi:hypothetical protein